MRAGKDTVFGALGVIVAALYWAAADEIPQSFLSDEIGADGVPKLLAAALGIMGAVVAVRSLSLRTAAAEGPAEWRAHAKAFGLFLIGALYMLLMPGLGYLIATTALIAAVVLYAGRGLSLPVPVIAIAGAGFLWFFFAKLFGIALPVGAWTHL